MVTPGLVRSYVRRDYKHRSKLDAGLIGLQTDLSISTLKELSFSFRYTESQRL